MLGEAPRSMRHSFNTWCTLCSCPSLKQQPVCQHTFVSKTSLLLLKMSQCLHSTHGRQHPCLNFHCRFLTSHSHVCLLQAASAQLQVSSGKQRYSMMSYLSANETVTFDKQHGHCDEAFLFLPVDFTAFACPQGAENGVLVGCQNPSQAGLEITSIKGCQKP